MTTRATAIAPSNIAFIKYWGTRDLDRTLPFNPSISMTLRACVSTCTVELSPGGEGAEVLWRDETGELVAPAADFSAGIERHVEWLLARSGWQGGYRVATRNSFPMGAGLASSASGFSALTLATVSALGQEPSSGELSILARESGSGSAARSVFGGYVEWPAGPGDDGAVQLYPGDHWELCDVVAVVDSTAKIVSSRQGHRRAESSPFFEERLRQVQSRLVEVRSALGARSLARLGPVVEEEAIELHLIAMSSRPPIYYWKPGTLEVLAEARRLREEGVGVWGTIDAGPNVHLICEPPDEDTVAAAMTALPAVRQVIRDRVGDGPRLTEDHLL